MNGPNWPSDGHVGLASVNDLKPGVKGVYGLLLAGDAQQLDLEWTEMKEFLKRFKSEFLKQHGLSDSASRRVFPVSAPAICNGMSGN